VLSYQALEEGEDMDALTERTRGRKERRATNKLLKDAEASGRATPASDDSRGGRKNKKGKAKMNMPDFDLVNSNGKRRRGVKSMSVTPSINDEDDEEREQVGLRFHLVHFRIQLSPF
jgi:ATP-dependent helicase STH1/SNF2